MTEMEPKSEEFVDELSDEALDRADGAGKFCPNTAFGDSHISEH